MYFKVGLTQSRTNVSFMHSFYLLAPPKGNELVFVFQIYSATLRKMMTSALVVFVRSFEGQPSPFTLPLFHGGVVLAVGMRYIENHSCLYSMAGSVVVTLHYSHHLRRLSFQLYQFWPTQIRRVGSAFKAFGVSTFSALI